MSARPRRVCTHWLRGKCHFGLQCRFAHEKIASGNHVREITGRRREENPAQDAFQAWRRRRHTASTADKRDWIAEALALLDYNIDTTQQVVRELALDTNLHIVRSLVESVESVATTSGRTYLVRTIMPLFCLLSHPQVIDSAVLEQEVGILYRCLLGHEASRLRTLFMFILDVAKHAILDNDDPAEDTMLEGLSVSAAILAKVVDSSVSTQLNPSFCEIAERFLEVVEDIPNSELSYFCIQASKHLEYVRKRLDIGKALHSKSTNGLPAVNRAHFTLTQDLPGRLSSQGRRHNNDHENIADISLMPTGNEIMSLRDEYLPTTDADMHHVKGVKGLLDRHFRLIREDLFYDLRNAVRSELEQLSGQAPTKKSGELRTKVRSYQLTRPTNMTFARREGLELEVQMLQPPFARRPDKKRRVEAWSQGQRLSPGSLVCAVDELGRAIFFLVSQSTQVSAPDQHTGDFNRSGEEGEKRRMGTLADDAKFAYLRLQPVEQTERELVDAVAWFKSLSGPFIRRLLEFPGILIPSALPPLKVLQKMSDTMDLPFQDILTNPDPNRNPLRPPLYSLRAGFSFDLSCLCSDGTQLRYRPSDTPVAQDLSRHSTLDLTQASAILNSLRRSIAVTQGPPGTGKSYTGEALIKVLLANKKAAELGPIICVCYTNHALDQLLEHLLDGGVEQIVRIGSRSKSERLAEVNLRHVTKSMTRTRIESKKLYESYSSIEYTAEQICSQLETVKFTRTDDLIKAYLADEKPEWHHALFGGIEKDEDGFQSVSRNKKVSLKQWLGSGHEGQDAERDISELESLWASDLPRRERLALYDHWLMNATSDKLNPSRSLFEEFTKSKRANESLRAGLDLRCLQSANIIGVTTTGLARNIELLRRVRSKVLLCEEAGEVLEGHLLTALLPSIEHVVLIGDHQQLRPQIQDWRLQRANPAGVKYSLDTSLFERLVQPLSPDGAKQGIPFSVLDTQRRMHPNIAELIRSTLYPNLVDAENVTGYPQVPGMARRLFWMDHAQPEVGHEQGDAADTSRSNDFEVDMVSELVSHLLRQGTYKSGDIAVLTPYLGQLHKIRKKLGSTTQIVLNDRDTQDLVETDLLTTPQIGKSSSLAEVRAATVDNFQGEEAKVVIVSLVRSNEQRRPGFLNTSNRINVLLSRARHGMYLIGNSSTFSTVPMWSNVRRLLGDNCGTKLQLQCPRHTSTEILVEKPEDFLILAPDGGCTLPCEKRLACGHACTGRCHSDALHSAVKCLEPCPRFKDGCDHKCPRSCGEPCENRCNATVNMNLVLDCGHLMESAPCWQAQNLDSLKCMVLVTKTLPICGHQHTVPCSKNIKSNFKCTASCGSLLSCGHHCKGPCHQCHVKDDAGSHVADHGPCTQPCGRNFTTCSHSCGNPCHGEVPCSPCAKTCENRCQHSKCGKKCSEPCAPCAETRCSSRCPHSACTMPCAAPCDWVPCSLRCEKTLSCGHRCPSVCGEECPSPKFCQVCASEDVKSLVVDYIMYSEYKDVNLDEQPCIIPDCGHPLTLDSMDGQMGMADHYTLSDEDVPVAVKEAQQPFSSPEGAPIKVCPKCRGSLRSISRYGRIVRRGLLDETTKKFISWSNGQLKTCLDDFAVIEDTLGSIGPIEEEDTDFVEVDCSIPRQKYLAAMCDSLSTGSRYSPLKRLRGKLQSLLKKVSRDEQPYQRVANLMRFLGKGTYEAEVQMSGYIKTLGVLLRCDLLILGAYLKRCPDRAAAAKSFDFGEYLKDCDTLISLAQEKDVRRNEIEGRVLLARFLALLPGDNGTGQEETTSYREQGEEQLRLAERVMRNFPSAKALLPELELARKELRGSFYSSVSLEERTAVYRAMSQEFLGTGHWYTCERGHPFTIGECGMPMEQAHCPECGAHIGGQHHRPVEGVQHDTEMEGLARDLNGMNV